MWISRYFVLLILFAFAGWIFEIFYCSWREGALKEGRFVKRGFLYGPICPIYGVGAVAVTMLADYAYENGYENLLWWQVFLITFFGSGILEYVTSWTLEKLFHAVWWDYRDLPLHINGRVCLPAATLFGCSGCFIYFVIQPWMRWLLVAVPDGIMNTLAMILLAVLMVDITLTVSTLVNFDKTVKKFEQLYAEKRDMVIRRVKNGRTKNSEESGLSIARELEKVLKESLKRIQNFANIDVLPLRQVHTFKYDEKEIEKGRLNLLLEYFKIRKNKE